jgi:hypothetical protein
MRLVVLMCACILTACGSTVATPDASAPSALATSAADAMCAQTGYTGIVAGAFVVPAADLAQQDETRGGATGPHPVRSSFRDYPSDALIVLCFFDGFIAAPGGPAPIRPATFRPYDRYVVTVDPAGHAALAVAGHRDSIAVAPRLP